VLAVTVLHAAWPAAYLGLLQIIGLVPTDVPFLDASYVLGSAECARRGVDIYSTNPCDPMGRVYDYSPLLIDLMPPGVTAGWTMAVGLILALAFYASLALLPPVRGRWPMAAMVLASLSTMCAYALERANIDALILIMMIGAGALAGGREARRLGGHALVLSAGLLKFYPLAGLVLLAREPPRRGLAIAACCLLVLLLLCLAYGATLFQSIGNRPIGFSFTDAFAAANLPQGAAILLGPLGRDHPALAPVLAWMPAVLGLVFALRALLQAMRYAMRMPAAVWEAPEAPYLAMGAALIVGCFFTGFSIYYRGVDFLLVLPGLLALGRTDRTASGVVIAILFLMWSEAFRQGIVQGLPLLGLNPVAVNNVHALFWLIRELVWWRVVAVLLGIVLAFVASTFWGRWALQYVPHDDNKGSQPI